MKRIATIVVLLGLVIGCQAQMLYQRHVEIAAPLATDSTDVDSTETCKGQGHDRIDLMLGLSAGVNLFTNDNQWSPYYSKYGLMMQVPLLLQYDVSPHWRLSTGARLDFTFNPLHYNVGGHEVDDGNGYTYADGLDFQETFNGKQHYFTYFFHLGIPVQATWYPWPHEKRLLSVTGDLFAGYALGNDIFLNRSYADRNGGSTGIDDVHQVSHHVESLLRWKLEVGVTLSTDVLGLIHGVRFFANMLPSYRDPVTGSDLYLAGMTVYL